MNRLYRFAIPALLALILSACGGQSAQEDQVAAAEEPMEEAAETYSGPNADLIAEFNASGEIFLAAIEGVSTDQWTFRESDDRWSIAEVTEHMVMTEQMLVNGFLTGLVAGEPNSENTGGYEEMDAGVKAFIRDRSNPIQTSEALEPTGAYATPEEGIAAFEEVRANTIQFLKTTDADLRLYSGTITPEIDPMDAYQWLLFAAGHVERHAGQIAQVKAHESYPVAS